jgi:hypothetical protein
MMRWKKMRMSQMMMMTIRITGHSDTCSINTQIVCIHHTNTRTTRERENNQVRIPMNIAETFFFFFFFETERKR